MSGDLKNAARQAAVAARRIAFPVPFTLTQLLQGAPELLLALLKHAVAEFSPTVTERFVGAGVRFSGKFIDSRTCEYLLRSVFRVMGIRCKLSTEQFMAVGAFVEVKLRFVTEVVNAVVAEHEAAVKTEELAKLRVIPHVTPAAGSPAAYTHPKFSTSHLRPLSAHTRTSSRASTEHFESTGSTSYGASVSPEQAASKVRAEPC